MELLAIPLGCQNTAAKWLVMRRCAVLATAAAPNLRRAEVSLHRNGVVAILMYFCVQSGCCVPCNPSASLRTGLHPALLANFLRRLLRGRHGRRGARRCE